jgi:chemotaxis protein methyltransferase CheR
VLLQEMQHRVANSLQIIASILLLKARAVTSDETRLHLHDAHRRVMSVAAVQQHLHASDGIDKIEVSAYLTTLCGSLATSMIGESRPISIEVRADKGMIDSARAVSIGLVVTELLINAIKYAFPFTRADALITVSYEISGPDWKLTVADNGIGKLLDDSIKPSGGLGTAIVRALVTQLDAQMEIITSAAGMTIMVSHATFQPPASLVA